MLVAMFIGVFILGVIGGIAGFYAITMRISNFSFDEMNYVGGMLLDASKNRDTMITTVKNGELVDAYVLKKQ